VTNDEKILTDEKEPRELVKDEVSDLLPLYGLNNPTKESIKEALEEHFAKFGHVGFNSSADEEAVDSFYGHLTKNSREYLKAELAFAKDLLERDLSAVVEQGYIRAKAVLPQEDYENPQTVFVMNGQRTDAKVMGDGQFGVNLQNLFNKVYSRESNTYDKPEALDKILNFCAHEGNHVLLKQVEHTGERSANWLVNVAFGEGLATFAQTGFDFPWSEDYLKDSQFWLETVKQVAGANDANTRTEILQKSVRMEL